MAKFIYLIFFSFLMVACSQTKMLQKSLDKISMPLDYSYDIQPSICSKKDSLVVFFNGIPWNTPTKVSKRRGKCFPFLIVNYFESNMGVSLGKNSVYPDYNDFFFDSMLDECYRSGCFTVCYDSTFSDSVYKLTLSIDTCETKSNYRTSTTILYFIYAYSTSYFEKGYPAETHLSISARLSKGESLIFDKTYSVERKKPFSSIRGGDTNQLRTDFVANMVESLSLSSKECIEAIVEDINGTLIQR